ncbi:ABC transporter substrate-binding protein [Neobacillus drentensis]|uniref:ABC transporter substrate-binding protein n=1 Tax=Neobacillus drentensis TaxID=220684 RepID=UPI001F2940C2|nr:ABC transporter substrate-binding protein [Neobacillus drentensis]ULT58757.1 ABC transporter substrate-binding protein [Neobacillus drentensis]
MEKKALSFFLMLVMVVSVVLSGCSSKESSGAASGGDSKDKPYEITMAYLYFTKIDDLPAVQAEINKITKKKINATVKLMPIEAAAWQQQSTLLLTGNEKVDLMLATGTAGYSLPATKGQFLPLDDLLKKYGKGIIDAVPKHVLEGAKVDGKIYGVPSIRDFAANYGFVMRKDIVDKYHIDLSQVKSFEDLTNVFKTVKENEPGMAPIANTTTFNQPAMVIDGGNFDILGDSLGVVSFKEKKVVNLFEQPEYVKAVDLARQWYKAGYTLKNAANITDANVSMVKSGKGFGYFSHQKPGFALQESAMTGHEMVAVTFTKPYSYTDAAIGLNLAITRNSQNPEKTMQFLNLLYTDKDIMNLLANGIEGKHYQVNSDGTIKLPDGVKESNYVFNQWELGDNALTRVWQGNDVNYWDEMLKFNDSAVISPAFGFQFNPDPVKTEIAASTNVINQYKAALEAGALDPNKTFPEFNKKLKAAGIDKIIAEKQKQFDAWKKNN